MTKLAITKTEEAIAVATIWNMGVESLAPHEYGAFDETLRILCETRGISREVLAGQQIRLSGKASHTSDCETSNAPAYVCGPCDCGDGNDND